LTISTVDLVAELSPPPPIHYQSEAASLLDEVLAWVSRRRVPSVVVDALDATSYEVVTRGALVLGYLDLLERAQAAGISSQALQVRRPDALLAIACHSLNRFTGSAWSTPRRLQLYETGARTWLHRYKRTIRAASPRSARDRPPVADLIVVAHQPGHLAEILEIDRELEARGIRALVITDHERVQREAADRIPVLLLSGSRRSHFRAWSEAMALARTIRSWPETRHSHRGRAFRRLLLDRVWDDVPRFIVAGRALDHMRADSQARVTLAVNPYAGLGRLALLRARRRGDHSVALQHGSVFWADPRWRDCPASLTCVWGEWSKSALIAGGVLSDAIRVTGAPRLDSSQVQARHAPASNSRTVLVAVSGAGDHVSMEQHALFASAVRAGADRCPDVRWVVKLHPKDRLDLYQDKAGTTGRLTVVESGHDRLDGGINRYLEDAGVLVTVSSTTALDAARMDVPVVKFQVIGEDSTPDFVRDLAVAEVSDAGALARAVRAILDGEHHEGQGVVQSHLAHRGHAVEATVDAIEEIVRAGGDLAQSP
jgi:hypothetical protein